MILLQGQAGEFFIGCVVGKLSDDGLISTIGVWKLLAFWSSK
jgi:hypothetical protein